MRGGVRIALGHDAAMIASNAERRFAPSIHAPCQSSRRRLRCLLLWLSHPFGAPLPRTRYNDPGDLPLDRAFTIDVATAILPAHHPSDARPYADRNPSRR